MTTAISGTLATMGPAVSYALAGKFAFPDRPVVMDVKADPNVIALPPHRHLAA